MGFAINEYEEKNQELQERLLYTYSMKYLGKYDSVMIDSISLYPNQLLKGQSATLKVKLENHEETTQGVVVDVKPYNTDKISITPSRYGYGIDGNTDRPDGSNAFNGYETKTFNFIIKANDVAGTYFITWLEITVYGKDEIIDVEKVPIIITTSLDQSFDELLTSQSFSTVSKN